MIAVQIRLDVIAAAHRNYAAKQIGMLEVFVCRQERSQTCSGGNRPRILSGFVTNQRQHFVRDISVVSRQQLGLQLRRHLFIKQAPAIDAVD